MIVKADIAKSEDCERLVQEAAAYGDGKVAVLVNNAGITRDNLLARMTNEELDAVIDVNLKGSFYMMRAVSRLMLKARFKKQVIPGDVLELNCEIITLRGPLGIGKAVATVDGKIAVTAELTFAIDMSK